MTPPPEHMKAICTPEHKERYVTGGGRGCGHTDSFRCPICGRAGRFSLNFLGRRYVVCDGRRFTRELVGKDFMQPSLTPAELATLQARYLDHALDQPK